MADAGAAATGAHGAAAVAGAGSDLVLSADLGDEANPLTALVSLAKQFTEDVNSASEELPAAVAAVKTQVSIVMALADELLRDGGDKDFPPDLIALVQDVVAEVGGARDVLSGWVDASAKRPRWARIAHPTRTLVEGHGTTMAVFLAAPSPYQHYTYSAVIMAAILLLTLYFLFPSTAKDLVGAWRTKEVMAQFAAAEADLKEHAARLRHFMHLQGQLREARRYDVSKSVLDDEPRRFWCSQFGAETHTIATDRLVETLLFEAALPTESLTTRALKASTLSRVIDVNNDGNVSPAEFHAFLQYFGPLKKCVSRALGALLVITKDGPQPSPWFTWRKMDRADVERLLPAQGKGTFLVRASSEPGVFAMSHVVSAEGTVRHYKVRLLGEAGYALSGMDKKYEDVGELVRSVGGPGGLFTQAFVDHSARCTINVGGVRFETMMGTFLKYPDSKLGKEVAGVSGQDAEGGGEAETVFLDRDPAAFAVVLNFCRTGRVHVPPTVSRAAAVDEFSYLQIPLPDDFDPEEPAAAAAAAQLGHADASGGGGADEMPTSPPEFRRKGTYMTGRLTRQMSRGGYDSIGEDVAAGHGGDDAAAEGGEDAPGAEAGRGGVGGAASGGAAGSGNAYAEVDTGKTEGGTEASADDVGVPGAGDDGGKGADRPVEDPDPANSPWFHGPVSGGRARELLAGKRAGAFLFRASASDPTGCVVLSFVGPEGTVVEQKVYRSPVGTPGGPFALTRPGMAGPRYESLRQLVASGVIKLTVPVNR